VGDWLDTSTNASVAAAAARRAAAEAVALADITSRETEGAIDAAFFPLSPPVEEFVSAADVAYQTAAPTSSSPYFSDACDEIREGEACTAAEFAFLHPQIVAALCGTEGSTPSAAIGTQRVPASEDGRRYWDVSEQGLPPFICARIAGVEIAKIRNAASASGNVSGDLFAALPTALRSSCRCATVAFADAASSDALLAWSGRAADDAVNLTGWTADSSAAARQRERTAALGKAEARERRSQGSKQKNTPKTPSDVYKATMGIDVNTLSHEDAVWLSSSAESRGVVSGDPADFPSLSGAARGSKAGGGRTPSSSFADVVAPLKRPPSSFADIARSKSLEIAFPVLGKNPVADGARMRLASGDSLG
jgi:hypothetical protein